MPTLLAGVLVLLAASGCSSSESSPFSEDYETQVAMFDVKIGEPAVFGWHEFAIEAGVPALELVGIRVDTPSGIELEDAVVVALEASDAVVGAAHGPLDEVIPSGRARSLEGFEVGGSANFYIAFQYRLMRSGCYAIKDIVLEFVADGKPGTHTLLQEHYLTDEFEGAACGW